VPTDGVALCALQMENRRRLEEQLEQEKEKRIEQTKEMAVRRIFKRELTRGWVAWYDQYVEKARERNLLKASASRLTKPKLVACVHFWREDWRAEQAEALNKQALTTAQRLEKEVRECTLLAAQVEQLNSELAEARQAAMEGRGLEVEMRRRMEEELAAEKEKRVEHTKEMAVRRIFKRELTRGWVAWYDLYVEKARERNLLRSAGAKLSKPKLVASVLLWRRKWEADEMAKASASLEEKLQQQVVAMGKELETVRAQVEAAKAAGFEVAATEEELRHRMEERLAAEKEKRIEHTKEMAIRRIFRRELVRGWQAWYETYWARVREANLLKASASRLTKPKLVACLHLWREDWRAEQTRLWRASVTSVEEKLRQQLAQTNTELAVPPAIRTEGLATAESCAAADPMFESRLAGCAASVGKERRVDQRGGAIAAPA
jgi:hypothetical protein